jgi:hypothetical protein
LCAPPHCPPHVLTPHEDAADGAAAARFVGKSPFFSEDSVYLIRLTILDLVQCRRCNQQLRRKSLEEEDAELGSSIKAHIFLPNDSATFLDLMTVTLLIFPLSRDEEVLELNKDSGFFLPAFFYTCIY